uniref:Acyl_transf_3 domain-containing protein n=1 Tax=Macrostomum lignano TaxID=282301 RepID=A0A1I8JNZ4_9PLAT
WHNFITYLWLHWEKGAPFEPLDQGESRTLTHWEQLDDGVQFTANKKFLLVVPTVVFLLATFYTAATTKFISSRERPVTGGVVHRAKTAHVLSSAAFWHQQMVNWLLWGTELCNILCISYQSSV